MLAARYVPSFLPSMAIPGGEAHDRVPCLWDRFMDAKIFPEPFHYRTLNIIAPHSVLLSNLGDCPNVPQVSRQVGIVSTPVIPLKITPVHPPVGAIRESPVLPFS